MTTNPSSFLTQVVDSLSAAGLTDVTVTSNRSSLSFDDAEVLLSMGHLALRCIRDRGVESVEIGPSHLDGIYHLLEDIDVALEWGEDLWRNAGGMVVSDYAQVISRHIGELEAVFDEAVYDKRAVALRDPEARRRAYWTSQGSS